MFLDYNQNARDRTVASAYRCARRPTRACRAPLDVGRGRRRRARPTCTLDTVPARLAEPATRRPTIDDARRSLDPLLDLARRDEEEGLGDAPWPPNFAKQPGEPKRVQPSRARRDD